MVLALSQASSSPPFPAMLGVLINDLVPLPRASVLVLDDYHVIRERSIHEAIAFLLDHIPPRFHLLIATREEPPLPLARLRGRNAVAELGQADLRFRTDEVTTFLQGWLGLTVSPADVGALEARTEGWITGLQLAALSMQKHADVAGFLAAFGGSDRHVLDYLVEEVLDRQPRHVQDFLLRTSILDRFCGPLCDAVTGLTGGGESGENGRGTSHKSPDILGQLERANLFLVPLDAEGHWYRYHQLFADMLRARLSQTRPDLLGELHGQASAWLEHAGLIPEAIDHAFAGGDVERAAVLIEQHAPLLFERGQTRAMIDWLDALPPELVRVHPFLAMIRIFSLEVTGDPERAQEHLRDVEQALEAGLPAEQEQIIRGQVAVVRSGIVMNLSGDLERAVARSQQALELLPPTDRLTRLAALANATAAYLLSGDVGLESEHTVAAAESAWKSANPGLRLRNIAPLARLRAMQGRLHRAAATYARNAQTIRGHGGGDVVIGGVAYYFGMGDILREWNDLDAAERLLAQGVDALPNAAPIIVADVLLGHTAMAGVKDAWGDGPGAIATMEAFMTFARRRGVVPAVLAQAAAVLARLRLRQGDLPAATRWMEGSGLAADGEVRYPQEVEHLTLVRILIAQGRAEEAMLPLNRWLEAAEAGTRMGSVLEILILRALALHAQKQTASALVDLARALVLAEPEAYVRIFADEGQPMAALLEQAAARGLTPTYTTKLLAATRTKRHRGDSRDLGSPVGMSALVEPLTEREREVLRLLAAGASNAEIARGLVVAVSTVHTHVHNILAKMNVRRRTQAIAKAKELSLL